MPQYSVAAAKDNLSSLIDKALAGEEVVITRRGHLAVALVAARATPRSAVKEANERLRAELSGKPPLAIPSSYFREWLYGDDDY